MVFIVSCCGCSLAADCRCYCCCHLCTGRSIRLGANGTARGHPATHARTTAALQVLVKRRIGRSAAAGSGGWDEGPDGSRLPAPPLPMSLLLRGPSSGWPSPAPAAPTPPTAAAAAAVAATPAAGTTETTEPLILHAIPAEELTPEHRRRLERARERAAYHSDEYRRAAERNAQIQQQLSEAVQQARMLSLTSRIYIGGVPPEAREPALLAALAPFGPVKEVAMVAETALVHRGFAFVEFSRAEPAYLAVEAGQIALPLPGRCIRTSRPTSADAAVRTIVDRWLQEAAGNATLWIACVHPELTAEEISSVFAAFGPIKSCNLVPDPLAPNKHRGYGLIEFEQDTAAIEAAGKRASCRAPR